MNRASVLGKICAFYARKDGVVKGVPVPGFKQLVGTIVEAKDEGPARGGIPNLILTVKGRSGLLLKVDYVEQHVRLFDTWEQAIESSTT